MEINYYKLLMALEPYYFEDKIEACLDEVGLGCIAGPVVAAAVIWPHPIAFTDEDDEMLCEINDSKKLSKKKRDMLRSFIEEHALSYSVQFIDVKTIDKINIYHARFKAMHNAITDLALKPEALIVDGDKFVPYIDPETKQEIAYVCVIKGDAKYQGIAAASILAKVARDEYMENLHKENEVYGWKDNKGYGTSAHYDAIKLFGPSEHHRTSFNLHLEDDKPKPKILPEED
jgi:ribonuclease HII